MRDTLIVVLLLVAVSIWSLFVGTAIGTYVASDAEEKVFKAGVQDGCEILMTLLIDEHDLTENVPKEEVCQDLAKRAWKERK